MSRICIGLDRKKISDRKMFRFLDFSRQIEEVQSKVML